MRVHTGPGYRVCFVQKKQIIWLLLCGGSKSTQSRDIVRAKKTGQNVAKARGIGAIAESTALGRESLYKAMAPGAKPRYDTVLKVLQSLGVKLTVSVA